jgi:urease accessory protein
MVAVGLAAVMLGSRARLAIPAAFVSVMILGFVAALAGMNLPFVEPVILASAVVIGLLVAVARPASPTLVAAIVGGFAFFHGHAHGAEMAGANALLFGTGFVLATAFLHAVGIGVGIAAGRLTQGTTALRIAGGATALGGALLLAS